MLGSTQSKVARADEPRANTGATVGHLDWHDAPKDVCGVTRLCREPGLLGLLPAPRDSELGIPFRPCPGPKTDVRHEFLQFVKRRLGDMELWTGRCRRAGGVSYPAPLPHSGLIFLRKITKQL